MNRHGTLAFGNRMAVRQEILRRAKALPTLSPVLQRITLILEDPRASAHQVAAAIEGDQVMTSKVLRLVNSAFYGFPRKVASVSQAVVILGLATVKNLVLGTAVMEAFRGGPEGRRFHRQAFWRHSLGCAVAARVLGGRLGVDRDEHCFVAGLLHDLGKVVLDVFFQEAYDEAVALAEKENLLLVTAEERVLGITHAEVGEILAEVWQFPPALVEALRFHHQPPLATRAPALVRVVHVADILTRVLAMGWSGDQRIPLLVPGVLEGLKTDVAFLRSCLPEVDRGRELADLFLGG